MDWTEDDLRTAERLIAEYHGKAAAPLVVNRVMFEQMAAAGMDMQHVISSEPAHGVVQAELWDALLDDYLSEGGRELIGRQRAPTTFAIVGGGGLAAAAVSLLMSEALVTISTADYRAAEIEERMAAVDFDDLFPAPRHRRADQRLESGPPPLPEGESRQVRRARQRMEAKRCSSSVP